LISAWWRPIDLLHRIADLADGGLGAGGVDGEFQQVAFARSRAWVRALSARTLIASSRSRAGCLSRSTCCSRTGVVDLEDVDGLPRGRRNLLTPTTVCWPLSMRACVRAAASSMRSLGMPARWPWPCRRALRPRGCAPQALAARSWRQALDIVAAAPRVDDAGARFLLQEELRVARDAGGEVGRQRERFVQRVGVQRLRVALRGAIASMQVRTTLL
jgi:hypothetical protein